MQPQLLHTYQNHHLDSLRWERFVPRDDDIVISTSLKSGTTWTQSIVRELIVHAMMQTDTVTQAHLPELDNRSSIWLDARWGGPVEEMHQMLAMQPHRRSLKTHLPLDGLPFYPQVKYLVIGRDPRDVFMSLWNHYSSYTDDFYALLNEDPNLPGAPSPAVQRIFTSSGKSGLAAAGLHGSKRGIRIGVICTMHKHGGTTVILITSCSCIM